MPINDLGYRAWDGTRSLQAIRPWVVARSGISLVWRRRWLRMMLILAWLPIVVPAAGLFVFEYSSTEPEFQQFAVQVLSGPLNQPELANQIIGDPAGARHEVWSILILAFFRYPQLLSMVVLIGLVAPMLVSYDLRTKAYLIYFSRPLSPTQYVIGKSAVIWFLLSMIVTVPALILYGIGVLVSSDFSVVNETWDIPLRILAASAVLMIPTTALAMGYSSLTSESRYATFAWFATWAMGFVAYQVLTFSAVAVGNNRPRRGSRGPVDWESLGVDLDRWRLLSPYHTLGKVEAWVFDLDSTPASVVPAFAVLATITVVGFWLVRRRIIARLSV